MDIKKELISRYPLLSDCEKDIISALNLMKNTCVSGGTIYVCGNGGSCSDSDHIVGELMKGFLSKRPLCDDERKIFEELYDDGDKFAQKLQKAIPAVSLTAQSAVLSAFANDVDADFAYAQLVYGYARKNDLVIGISTSGNSKNIVNAIKAAKARGAKTLSLTGCRESILSGISDVTIRVPEYETYKIQELHLPVYHYLCAALEEILFLD